MTTIRLVCARSNVQALHEALQRTGSAQYCSQYRLFSIAAARCSDANKSVQNVEDKPKQSHSSPVDTRHMVEVQWLDRRCLVWDKRYKSVDEVPSMLPYHTVVASRNRFRIRANLVMVAMTIVAAVVMVLTGKERARAGDTVDKRNLEKHRRLRAEKAEEDRLAAAASETAAK